MEEKRPAAIIREYLLLRMLQETVDKALIEARRELSEEDIKIISIEDNVHDIDVKYIAKNHHDEGIYMRRMLQAELKGKLRWNELKEHI